METQRARKVGHFRGGFDFAGLVARAREFRQKQTRAEELLWELLRGRRFLGLKFGRQHQFGRYVVDFYCHQEALVIECDGGVHDDNDQRGHDGDRDQYMATQGLQVMRFTNEQVLNGTETVLREIARRVGAMS